MNIKRSLFVGVGEKFTLPPLILLLIGFGACSAENLEAESNNQKKKQMYELEKGNQFALCREYEAFLNRAIETPRNTCGLRYEFDDLAREQGFLAVQGWKEVPKEEYVNQLRQRWISQYSDSPEKWRNENLTDEKFKVFYGKVNKVWVNQFDINFDREKNTVMRFITNSCMHSNFGYVVIDAGQDGLRWRNRRLGGGSLFLYKGRPYFSSGGVSVIYELSGGEQVVNKHAVCEIKTIILGDEK